MTTQKKSPSRQELEFEVQRLNIEVENLKTKIRENTAVAIIAAVCKMITTAFFWAGVVGSSLMVTRSIESLAGKSTDAAIKMDVTANSNAFSIFELLEPSVFFAILFGVCGVMYGLRQKKLRENDHASKGQHIRGLEFHIDPNRTSSGLTIIGTTNPNDS